MKRNVMRFEFIDNTNEDNFNETCIMERQWIGEAEEGQTMDIATFHTFCTEFAAAMGFCEETIKEWFGQGV